MDTLALTFGLLGLACLIAALQDWRDRVNRTDVALMSAVSGVFGLGFVAALVT